MYFALGVQVWILLTPLFAETMELRVGWISEIWLCNLVICTLIGHRFIMTTGAIMTHIGFSDLRIRGLNAGAPN